MRGERRAWKCAWLFPIVCLAAKVALAKPPDLAFRSKNTTGFLPKGISVSPDRKLAFVTNFGSKDHDNVRFYDTTTLDEVARIDFAGNAVESIPSPDGKTLYVSNFTRDSVMFVDIAKRAVAREVKTGQHPKIVVVSRDGSNLFTANWGTNDVTVLDTVAGKTVATLKVGKQPRGMALAADGKLYVADFYDDRVHVFAKQSEGAATAYAEERIFPVCLRPRHLGLSPDDRTLYVSCLHGSEIHGMDVTLPTPIVKVRGQVGASPKSIDISADGKYVYSADFGATSISVMDTNDGSTRIVRIQGIKEPCGLAVLSPTEVAVTGWLDAHIYKLGFRELSPSTEDGR